MRSPPARVRGGAKIVTPEEALSAEGGTREPSLSLLALASGALAQASAAVEQWLGPWNYESIFGPPPHPAELAHGDLQVTGADAGKVLLWARTNLQGHPTWLFDVNLPQNLETIPVPSGFTNIFCSAHVKLTTGETLVAGGDSGGHPAGLTTSWRYLDRTWVQDHHMQTGRWYPALIRLADNRAGSLGGQPNAGDYHRDYEIYDPLQSTHWALGPEAPMATCLGSPPIHPLHLYPRCFLLSTGRIYAASEESPCKFLLDLTIPQWSEMPAPPSMQARVSGCAVMFPDFHSPGPDNLVFFCGAPNDLLGTAALDTIEVNPTPESTSPNTWKFVNDDPNFRLLHARLFANAVILPDGSIFIIGGAAKVYDVIVDWYAFPPSLCDQYPVPVLEPELLYRHVATGLWNRRPLAQHSFPRLYHSVAILLPTGQVVSFGGQQVNWNPGCTGMIDADLAVYNPPYGLVRQ